VSHKQRSVDRRFILSCSLTFKLIRDLALLFFFVFFAFVVLEFDPSAKFTSDIFHILFYFISLKIALVCYKKNCTLSSSTKDPFIFCRLCESMIHVKCAGFTGRVKDFIDLNSGLMWSCGSCKEMVVEMSGLWRKLETAFWISLVLLNSSIRGSIPFVPNLIINKEERYSRVPRLSDTRYSAKCRYASSKARLKCATYRR